MKNKYIFILSTGLLFTLGAPAGVNSTITLVKKKKKSKKYPIQINLEVGTKLNENIDGLVKNKKVGIDTQSTTVKLTAKKRFKLPWKIRATSITSGSMKKFDEKDAYKETILVNENNLDITNRDQSLSQTFSFKKKVHKKVILQNSIELKVNSSNSIQQEVTATTSNYHLIDSSYNMFTTAMGARYRHSKLSSTHLLYKFNQFNYNNNYSYDESQGSNDRRIHSFGGQHRMKFKNGNSLAFSSQYNQIYYKDRLALSEIGFFQDTGVIPTSKLNDLKLKVHGTFRKNYSLGLSNTKRIDPINGGESYNERALTLGLKGNIKSLSYTLDYTSALRAFESQIADNHQSNRQDLMTRLSGRLTYPIGAFNLNGKYDKILNTSSYEYGDLKYNIIGVGVSTIF